MNLVSASTDNTLKLWDLSMCASRVIDSPVQSFTGHTNVKKEKEGKMKVMDEDNGQEQGLKEYERKMNHMASNVEEREKWRERITKITPNSKKLKQRLHALLTQNKNKGGNDEEKVVGSNLEKENVDKVVGRRDEKTILECVAKEPIRGFDESSSSSLDMQKKKYLKATFMKGLREDINVERLSDIDKTSAKGGREKLVLGHGENGFKKRLGH
ncbi:Protein SPA1-RELATED 3, partial [Mucuna pruriens]